jgi:hypothetical protein
MTTAFSTLYASWDKLLAETEDLSKIRLKFHDQLIAEITDPLKALASKKEEARRKVRSCIYSLIIL